ncbi:hypothetical protein BESB_030740 [Besnoitia besnoiti]|uniref:Uncharacterized protein n=1 Tax=Besnoitia besnoiti TaxID=94643 RepID=A0A2A9M714_BESBE|nr:hypothetical protein BESB_030740 [Besnoitia besnoiti]PFH31200.1 hypothetical protein BESB_030740 [Besnoitia besnoiti]
MEDAAEAAGRAVSRRAGEEEAAAAAFTVEDQQTDELGASQCVRRGTPASEGRHPQAYPEEAQTEEESARGARVEGEIDREVDMALDAAASVVPIAEWAARQRADPRQAADDSVCLNFQGSAASSSIPRDSSPSRPPPPSSAASPPTASASLDVPSGCSRSSFVCDASQASLLSFASPALKRQDGGGTPGVFTPQKESEASAQCYRGAQADAASPPEDEVGAASRVASGEAEGASETTAEARECAGKEDGEETRAAQKNDLFLGMWPSFSLAGTLEAPSLPQQAAACKRFTEQKQAEEFLATLSAEEKNLLQRRYSRVARQLARLPALRSMPQEKFRSFALKDEKAREDYVELWKEQEKQLRALQPHDIVFANLHARLKELYPERSDVALYDMCRRVCAHAKKEGRKDVLGPLRGALSHARFALAREHRKARSFETGDAGDARRNDSE